MKLKRFHVSVPENGYRHCTGESVEAEEVEIKDNGQLIFKARGRVIAAYAHGGWLDFNEHANLRYEAESELQEEKRW